ncbi:hypothetical protein PENSUB_9395 [Penicillium subrubescens]|jgi:hypothetical protein|uniref:Uncharacterized protein n=1 Tax=Penicillium subrubescens TaxID=1316194 RepID=A0A1Q5TDJ2_9EURO|nr:hypothetical protein PENSUB_9395 [Penicillium subrubescens]
MLQRNGSIEISEHQVLQSKVRGTETSENTSGGEERVSWVVNRDFLASREFVKIPSGRHRGERCGDGSVG